MPPTITTGTNSSSSSDNESLYYNLTQCLHALRKLRDSRKLGVNNVNVNNFLNSSISRQNSQSSNQDSDTSSMGSGGSSGMGKRSPVLQHPSLSILEHLMKIDDAIVLCQCACLQIMHQQNRNNDSSTTELYEYVLQTLLNSSTGAVHTLLQLYFRKSIYWDHYYRNMIEIIGLLNYYLRKHYRRQQQQQKDASSSSSPKSKSVFYAYHQKQEFTNDQEIDSSIKFRRKFVPLNQMTAWRPRASMFA